MAVHGEEGGAVAAQVGDCAAHRLRDVVQLEVGKHLVAARGEPGEELEVALGGEKLKADLVEARRVAQLLDQRARLLGGRHVERDDETLRAGDGGHGFSLLEYCRRVRAKSDSATPQVSASKANAW